MKIFGRLIGYSFIVWAIVHVCLTGRFDHEFGGLALTGGVFLLAANLWPWTTTTSRYDK